MVFEKLGFLPNDPLHGWDGMFMGKLLNPGVYLYWVQGTTDDQEEIIITGDITLLH